MKNILVLQTSDGGHRMCRDALLQMSLKESDDFLMFESLHGIEDYLEPGKRQLFISGSLCGDVWNVGDFVHTLRERNPELVCVSYALNSLRGEFERHIPKSGNLSVLKECIDDFLTGRLVRSRGEMFWAPPRELVRRTSIKKIRRKVVILGDASTLQNVRTLLEEIERGRSDEVFFTQSPMQALGYVGDSHTAVVLTDSLYTEVFAEEKRYFFELPHNIAAKATQSIKCGWNFRNLVFAYGTHTRGLAHADLDGVLIVPAETPAARYALLAKFIQQVCRRPMGNKHLGLIAEKRELQDAFSQLDAESCVNLRPAFL